ncbi:MAG: multiheme c-type cytochrome [Planctomycetota bacterium]|jgi:hypothetical protein
MACRIASIARFLLALALVAGGLALPACGGGEEAPASPPTTDQEEPPPAGVGPLRYRTAEQCGACHVEIYEEWKASYHGLAMSDPLFLELAPVNKEECIRCHAPVPIREVDFDTPLARLDRRDDAISCVSCHQTGSGMAGPFDGLTGACNPVYDPDQQNAVKMCFGCHNQHGTGEEWLNGPYGPHASEPRQAEEKDCLDCHMPEVERPLVEGGPVRRGRRHTWYGGHHLPQLRMAADVDIEVEPLEGGGWRFRTWVENVGAGHNIPTDARHRSFDVYVKLWDADGNVILDPAKLSDQSRARTATYRKFYRNSGVRDTQVPPQTRVSTLEAERGYVDIPEATSGRGEVWLVYRLTPEDMLDRTSRTDPERYRHKFARVVTWKEFTYGP